MQKRILILGAAGMVGHKAWQTFRSRFENVYGTIRKPREHYARQSFFADAPADRLIDRLDLTEPTRVLPVLDEIKPDFIFNCIGLTLRRSDASSVEANIRVNALLPHVVNGWCERTGSRLISISTDCVFSGKTGGYTEESVTDARDAYGRSKALGEVESAHALVLRTSVIGREIENHSELFEWFLAQNGRTVKGFRRALYTGVTTNYISRLVADLIERFPGLTGLYQVASQPISKYDLLCTIRDHFNMDVEIIPDDTYEVRKDLVGLKFERATGLKTPSWDSMIADVAGDPTPYFYGGLK